MRDDQGWIRTLMEEAENERMHLMTFIEIAKPTWFERTMILLVQGVFLIGFSALYLLSAKTRTASSAISRRRPSRVTRCTCRKSTRAARPTFPLRPSRGITGRWRTMRRCATSSWWSATTRRIIVMSIMALRARLAEHPERCPLSQATQFTRPTSASAREDVTNAAFVERLLIILRPDPSRVVIRPYVPGADGDHARAKRIAVG